MSQALRRGTLRWEWLLALFTLASLIETIFWGQISAFTPLHLPRLGVAPAQVPLWTGIIAAVSGAFGIPFLPFWGALADRWARQPLIVRSFVAHLIAGILAVLAGSVWVFLLSRAIMTLSLGNSGLMMTTLSESAPPRRLGLAFAILNSAGPTGAFLGPLFGGPIIDRWGFQVLMLFNVAAVGVIIALLTFGYHDTYRGSDRGPLLQMAADSVRIVWRSPRLRTLFAALFVLFALADRYGIWRVLITGSIVAVALWPLPALTRSLVPFAIAYAVVNGVTSGVFAISFTALSGSAAVDVRGRVMSFAYLPANLGSILGPVVGSVVTQISIFAVFPAAALIMLMGVGMLLLARRQGEAAA
jgi:MFS family permease